MADPRAAVLPTAGEIQTNALHRRESCVGGAVPKLRFNLLGFLPDAAQGLFPAKTGFQASPFHEGNWAL